MYTAVMIIHLVVSFVLIVAVLFQVGKGATIGSTFGGGSGTQAVFGSSGGTSLLGKITAVCAALFMASSLYLTYTSSRQAEKSIMETLPEVSRPAEPAGDTPDVVDPEALDAPPVPDATEAVEPAPAGEEGPGMSAEPEAPAATEAPAEPAAETKGKAAE